MDVSFETQDLIREMLEVDYKKRLTAEQVRITLDYMLATKKRNLCSSQSVPNMTPEASGDKSKSKSVSLLKFSLCLFMFSSLLVKSIAL